MTEPYSQDLWNRHEHREEGHACQQATKQCVGVESMSRWGYRMWKHSPSQYNLLARCLDVLSFITKAWDQSNFGLILGGTPGGRNVLNGLDCATNDARRRPDRRGKRKEE